MAWKTPEARRLWYKKNKKRQRDYQTCWLYNLTLPQLDVMRAQGCGICGSHEQLRVDHNHKTGKVRGMLCSKHNVGLGQFDDDPALLRAAIAWLENN